MFYSSRPALHHTSPRAGIPCSPPGSWLNFPAPGFSCFALQFKLPRCAWLSLLRVAKVFNSTCWLSLFHLPRCAFLASRCKTFQPPAPGSTFPFVCCKSFSSLRLAFLFLAAISWSWLPFRALRLAFPLRQPRLFLLAARCEFLSTRPAWPQRPTSATKGGPEGRGLFSLSGFALHAGLA